jgi:hypothetical protein
LPAFSTASRHDTDSRSRSASWSTCEQAYEHDRKRAVVLRDVVRLRRVGEKPYALVEADSDHERVGFGRGVSGQPREEAAAHFEDGRAVVPDGGFDVGQRAADGLHPVERVDGVAGERWLHGGEYWASRREIQALGGMARRVAPQGQSARRLPLRVVEKRPLATRLSLGRRLRDSHVVVKSFGHWDEVDVGGESGPPPRDRGTALF